jgi:hypothetical protein
VVLLRSALTPFFALLVAFQAVDPCLPLASGTAVMFGVDHKGGTLQGLATIPEGLWELFLGLYCTFKGFRPSSPILRADAPPPPGSPRAARARDARLRDTAACPSVLTMSLGRGSPSECCGLTRTNLLPMKDPSMLQSRHAAASWPSDCSSVRPRRSSCSYRSTVASGRF